ncbi:hypothetical protein Maq22A_1p38330 (plasmid) [Methylobacterium aquaticum]|uniref:Uncharacterized protein n=1 Tax=Methylobacterium aquaticum TaxID=270351 RepID=A0A1Y0ZIV3_9HYPH|nr:hypothetical protein Maq22A_1p38330 [Methylobacterium aquaticum]
MYGRYPAPNASRILLRCGMCSAEIMTDDTNLVDVPCARRMVPLRPFVGFRRPGYWQRARLAAVSGWMKPPQSGPSGTEVRRWSTRTAS